MSCNGCRVLRKGCSERCILRPCLQWIESPEAQAHATVFVAKFFGRAGLMGFIGAVPENQRPALFQSLLYEACGRTVNPVHGAVGLLWAGNWHACQTAVETVLKGEPLRPVMSNIAFPSPLAPAFGLSAAPLLLGQRAADPSNTPQLTLGAPDSALRPLLNGNSSNNSNNKIMVRLDEAAGSRMEGKKRPRFATDGSTTNWSMSIKPVQPERPLASHQQGEEEEEGEEETTQGFASPSMPRITAARSHVTESCNNSAESHYCARKLVAPVPIRPIPWNSTSHYPRAGPLPLKDSVELDLTLNSSHVSSSPFNMGAVLPTARVSSPSINSEGSVTSSGTIDLPVSPSFHSCGRQERNLLKLMP